MPAADGGLDHAQAFLLEPRARRRQRRHARQRIDAVAEQAELAQRIAHRAAEQRVRPARRRASASATISSGVKRTSRRRRRRAIERVQRLLLVAHLLSGKPMSRSAALSRSNWRWNASSPRG